MQTARRLREESLSIIPSHRDQWVCGYLLWGIAKACLARANSDSARKAIQEWTAISRGKLGKPLDHAHLLHMLGDALLSRGDPVAAARMLGAARLATGARLELDPTDRADWEATVARLGAAMDSEARACARGNEVRQLGVWEAIDEGIRTRLRAIAA